MRRRSTTSSTASSRTTEPTRLRFLGVCCFVVLVGCLWAGAVAATGTGAVGTVPLGARDGGIEYFRHVFPVRGPHGERGPVGNSARRATVGGSTKASTSSPPAGPNW